jgi:hypothetical protein
VSVVAEDSFELLLQENKIRDKKIRQAKDNR